jgi:hypothetical protein
MSFKAGVTCAILGHTTKLVETEPEIREFEDGTKSSLRTWISHIECERCGKKWLPPSKEEIKRKLNKLNSKNGVGNK